jgi:molecular chaperone GrpE
MTLALFEKVLLNHSVKKFNPLGEKFNPNLHEALFQIPQEKEESGIIGNISQIGYMISDRVLRPAKVGVYKKLAPETTEEKKKE